jgi:CBS domain containing-hemolysin-like protein
MFLLVFVVCFALVSSFVCSLCEAALLSIGNSRVEQLAQRGSRAAQILRRFKRRPDVPIAAILILNTVAMTAGAGIATAQFENSFPEASAGWFILAFTAAILMLGEIVPKTLGVHYADALAVPVTHAVHWLVRGVQPLLVITRAVTTVLRGSKEREQVAVLEEIRLLATAGRSQGKLGALTAGIIERATHLREVRAREVMVSRARVVHLAGNRSIEENLHVVNQSGHSRFPFTPNGDLDRVEGFVLTKELLFHLRERVAPVWQELLIPLLVVPETATLNHVLRAFQRERRHMAMVVDEYGGIQGIVTLEDVLEEIVGEIDDEMDSEEAHLLKQPDGSLACRGIADLRGVFAELGIDATGIDSKTVSGFLAERFGGVPQAGQQLDFGGFRFRVAKASNKRAERVLVQPSPAGASDASA